MTETADTMDANMTAQSIHPNQRATASRGGGYWGLWRTLPREIVYLAIGFPLALVGFIVTITLVSAGVGMLAIVVGIFLVIAGLYVARAFGHLDLALIEWTGRPLIPRPEFARAQPGSGFFGWLKAVLGNIHYWLYLLYVMVVDFVVKTISWSILIVWMSAVLGGIASVIVWLFVPGDLYDDDFGLVFGVPDIELLDDGIAATIFAVVLWAAFAATLPLVTRGLVWVHWAIARGMLGRRRVADLEREVTSLSESRVAAQSAEGHSLRRLERDIHDGPQQRLVRMQMDLAAADRQLDIDPEKARSLIADAMAQSKDALDELRALSRGFAPPILLDRGLVAALESQAVRSSIPTVVVSELPPDASLPQELERNAYFVASEAIANAIKHSEATHIEVRVLTKQNGERTVLEVSVVDNGIGGATAVAGHGISGLQERLRGLGGVLTVDSPEGGPTTVVAQLPLVAAAPTL